MVTIGWLTDIHLNFLSASQIDLFYEKINSLNLNSVLITGDIAEAPTIEMYLKAMEKAIRAPIYFVLGNHDFYHGSIAEVREKISRFSHSGLQYLSLGEIVELTSDIALVGHDGWGDARYGDYNNSTVMLNDYVLIDELNGLSKKARGQKLKELGDDVAEYISDVVPKALSKYNHLVFATHIPMFKETCWHQGKISDDNWLPHFTCKAAGDALKEVMAIHPNKTMTILCGHTHSSGYAKILSNLEVLTGDSDYGRPVIRLLQIKKGLLGKLV